MLIIFRDYLPNVSSACVRYSTVVGSSSHDGRFLSFRILEIYSRKFPVFLPFHSFATTLTVKKLCGGKVLTSTFGSGVLGSRDVGVQRIEHAIQLGYYELSHTPFVSSLFGLFEILRFNMLFVLHLIAFIEILIDVFCEIFH